MILPANTARRLQVLDLRIQLEEAAEQVSRPFCNPGRYGTHRDRVARRLAFALCHVPERDFPEVARLLRLVRHVYARTSDLLHGHTDALTVTDAQIREWRAAVDRLGDLIARFDAHRPDEL